MKVCRFALSPGPSGPAPPDSSPWTSQRHPLRGKALLMAQPGCRLWEFTPSAPSTAQGLGVALQAPCVASWLVSPRGWHLLQDTIIFFSSDSGPLPASVHSAPSGLVFLYPHAQCGPHVPAQMGPCRHLQGENTHIQGNGSQGEVSDHG